MNPDSLVTSLLGLKCQDLSLYSTRTQNTWRRGSALGSAPDARLLRYPTQNIPTCWYLWRWVTQVSCVGHVHLIFLVYISFALGGQREPHFQWNIGGVGYSGVGHVYFMYISCCLCIIFRVGYANISRCKGIFQWNMGFRPETLVTFYFFKILVFFGESA